MSNIVFIGDELSATGFRLAGVDVVIATPQQAASTFAKARGSAFMVLMTAELAHHVPSADLEAAMRAQVPVIGIVPDMLFKVQLPDPVQRVRILLGIEA